METLEVGVGFIVEAGPEVGFVTGSPSGVIVEGDEVGEDDDGVHRGGVLSDVGVEGGTLGAGFEPSVLVGEGEGAADVDAVFVEGALVWLPGGDGEAVDVEVIGLGVAGGEFIVPGVMVLGAGGPDFDVVAEAGGGGGEAVSELFGAAAEAGTEAMDDKSETHG